MQRSLHPHRGDGVIGLKSAWALVELLANRLQSGAAMLALALSLVLAADSVALPDSPSIEGHASAAEPAHVALWVQPVGIVASPMLSALIRGAYVTVPVGINFPIGETEVAAELTASVAPASLLIGASFGPIVHSHVGSWVDGFFVQPKVRVEGGLRDGAKNIAGLAALDVGYQIRNKRLYLAFVFGAGLGYGFTNQLFDGFLSLMIPRRASEPSGRMVATINLNALRLGFAF